MKPPGPNDAAFPTHIRAEGYGDGMTMREWFAGQALPAVIAMSDANFRADYAAGDNPEPPTIAECARDAFRYADAMLAEAKKGGAA